MATSGWTGSLISPNMRVHDAAAAAVDAVGKQDMLQAITNPAHPDYSRITGQVLRDPTLGSRTAMSSNVPRAGTPVGSASVYQFPGTTTSGGIPLAVQQAIGNLNTNSQASSLQSLLNRVLGGQQQQQQVAAISPAQEELSRSQSALATTQNQILQAPDQIQSQIDALLRQSTTPMGIMSLALSAPGAYESSAQAQRDRQLQDLYGQQTRAKQAASGWTAPRY